MTYIAYLITIYDPIKCELRTLSFSTLRKAYKERDAFVTAGLRGANGDRYISVRRIEYTNETKVWRNGRSER